MYPYDVDNANNSNEALRIPKSKGREAMVYLSFIVDNYESLRTYTDTTSQDTRVAFKIGQQEASTVVHGGRTS